MSTCCKAIDIGRVLGPFTIALLSFTSSGIAAELPAVRFDAGRLIACRVAATEDSARADPDEKIIEVNFRVSTLVTAGKATDIDELLIMITSPEDRVRVVDFSPSTQMVTDVEGPIEVVETEDTAKSVDARLGGVASGGHGIVDLQLKPTLGGGVTQGHSLTQTLKRRAPMHVKVASGTIDGQSGVFFKLKRNTQSTLEGVKEYSCRFAVPSDWRAGRAMVSCAARTERKGFFGSRIHLCGSAEFSLGLYLEGDVKAKQSARNFSRISKTSSRKRQDSRKTACRCLDADLWGAFEGSVDALKDRLCCNHPVKHAQ